MECVRVGCVKVMCEGECVRVCEDEMCEGGVCEGEMCEGGVCEDEMCEGGVCEGEMCEGGVCEDGSAGVTLELPIQHFSTTVAR